jgi:hypothetical protein
LALSGPSWPKMFLRDLRNSSDLCNHWVFVAFLNQIAPPRDTPRNRGFSFLWKLRGNNPRLHETTPVGGDMHIS